MPPHLVGRHVALKQAREFGRAAGLQLLRLRSEMCRDSQRLRATARWTVSINHVKGQYHTDCVELIEVADAVGLLLHLGDALLFCVFQQCNDLRKLFTDSLATCG